MPDDTLRQIGAYATPLAAHLLDDCEVMACYAAAYGIAMPEWLGNALSKIGAKAQASREEIQRLELEPGGGDQQKIGELREGVGAAVRADLRGLVRPFQNNMFTALLC